MIEDLADTPAQQPRVGVLAGMSFVCRILVAAVWLLAGMLKLDWWTTPDKVWRAPQRFLDAIKAFKLPLPDWSMIGTAIFLPWLEVVVALALLFGVFTRTASIIIGALLVFFTGLIIYAIEAELKMESCGCFGEQGLLCSGAPDYCHVRENLAQLAMCVLIACTPRHFLAAENLLPKRGG